MLSRLFNLIGIGYIAYTGVCLSMQSIGVITVPPRQTVEDWPAFLGAIILLGLSIRLLR